jgi:hypothetical protein
VATIQNVETVNINDLGNALKPVLLLGTQLVLNIARVGEQAGQGVGYLEDGTMVVVDAAADKVGIDLRIEVSGTVQTSAGRLVFAKPLFDSDASESAAASTAAAATATPSTAAATAPQSIANSASPQQSPVLPPSPAAGPGAQAEHDTEADDLAGEQPGSAPAGPFGPRRTNRNLGRNPRR